MRVNPSEMSLWRSLPSYILVKLQNLSDNIRRNKHPVKATQTSFPLRGPLHCTEGERAAYGPESGPAFPGHLEGGDHLPARPLLPSLLSGRTHRSRDDRQNTDKWRAAAAAARRNVSRGRDEAAVASGGAVQKSKLSPFGRAGKEGDGGGGGRWESRTRIEWAPQTGWLPRCWTEPFFSPSHLKDTMD